MSRDQTTREVTYEEADIEGDPARRRNARNPVRRDGGRVLPSVADREAWTVEQRAAQSMRSRIALASKGRS